ncbi:MAG: CAP domain-containing protein [Lachnospiraceae bacterium]|nr:CAP domain-containing protein [Lachnospiraceae bacterium]
MRKVTLFTTTALTVLLVGGQAITTHAAVPNFHAYNLGNGKVYTYQLGCNSQTLPGILQNCLPDITLPNCNDSQDCNTPSCNIPNCDQFNCNAPDINRPETNLPGTNNPGNNDSGNSGSTEENLPGNNDTSEHAFIQEVVNLVNAERAKKGLAPLTIDTKIQAAAMVRAKECEQSFSHTRPDGSSFATALKEQNVSYRSAGENIAYGQRTPEEVMKAWMNSSGHRANIMNANFTTIGVGYYENANGTDYWCQIFTR